MNLNYYLWKACKRLNKKSLKTIFSGALTQKSLREFLCPPPHPPISCGTPKNIIYNIHNTVIINNYFLVKLEKNIPLSHFLISSGNDGVGE